MARSGWLINTNNTFMAPGSNTMIWDTPQNSVAFKLTFIGTPNPAMFTEVVYDFTQFPDIMWSDQLGGNQAEGWTNFAVFDFTLVSQAGVSIFSQYGNKSAVPFPILGVRARITNLDPGTTGIHVNVIA